MFLRSPFVEPPFYFWNKSGIGFTDDGRPPDCNRNRRGFLSCSIFSPFSLKRCNVCFRPCLPVVEGLTSRTLTMMHNALAATLNVPGEEVNDEAWATATPPLAHAASDCVTPRPLLPAPAPQWPISLNVLSKWVPMKLIFVWNLTSCLFANAKDGSPEPTSSK